MYVYISDSEFMDGRKMVQGRLELCNKLILYKVIFYDQNQWKKYVIEKIWKV